MILFVCSLGKLRSRTAELLCLFGGVDARCCGTQPDALQPATDALLREADLVVCMEATHETALASFQHYGGCPVITLNIRDVFNRLDPLLVRSLVQQLAPLRPELAAAMARGAALLANQPGYEAALGTASPLLAEDSRYLVFPSI